VGGRQEDLFYKGLFYGIISLLNEGGSLQFLPENWVGHVLFCKNKRVNHIKLVFIKKGSAPTPPEIYDQSLTQCIFYPQNVNHWSTKKSAINVHYHP